MTQPGRESEVQLATWPSVVAALAIYALGLVVCNLPMVGGEDATLTRLEDSTNGWVSTQWLLPWMVFIPTSVAIFRFGRLRLSDIGWRARDLPRAAVVALVFWMAMQVSVLLVLEHTGEVLKFTVRWQLAKSYLLAALVAQLIGNSLVEETIFRGYLLQQLCRGSGRLPRMLNVCWGTLASSGLFVLSHVPVLLAAPVSIDVPSELSWLSLFGFLLALLFLVTRNLFVCVGLHALWNARPMILDAAWQADPAWERTKSIWYALAGVLIGSWWLIDRIERRRKRPAALLPASD